MPEIGIREHGFFRDLKSFTPKGEELPSVSALGPLAAGSGLELVGHGGESIVVEHRNNQEKVVAISYKNLEPRRAKQIYYFQKVLSTLFPHNFPHFYAGFGDPGVELKEGQPVITGTIRKKINGKTSESLSEKRNPNHAFPFTEVDKVCKELELPVRLDLDWDNYLVSDDDDGVYYMDTIKPNGNVWNLENILQYIRKSVDGQGKKVYSEQDEKSVEVSIIRLGELGAEMIHDADIAA